MRDLTKSELEEFGLEGRWRLVEGFEESYLVSEIGEVYSIRSDKKLKPIKHNKGYLYFNLSLNGKMKRELAHRLVAQAFIPNQENKPQVNHINGNKENNHISNLEWCTRLENMRHAFDNNLIKPAKGSKVGSSKLKEKDVLEIIELLSQGKPQKEIAEKFNVGVPAISDIKRGKNWSHLTNITPKHKRVS